MVWKSIAWVVYVVEVFDSSLMQEGGLKNQPPEKGLLGLEF